MNPIRTAFAAALLFALPAMAEDLPPTATLTATGDGVVMVTPDIAIVTLGVTTRAEAAGAALAANSKNLAQVIAAVKDSGVADKDIATTNFAIGPVYPPDRGATDKPPQIVGYDVSNEVRVTIRDIAQSGAILDKVVSAGANRVTGISFDVADRTATNDQALKAAIAEARRKAALMAEAAGVKLVRILTVAASEGGGPMPMYARVAAEAVPVMPGQQATTVTATVTFEVAPE